LALGGKATAGQAGIWDEVEPIGQPARGKEQLHPAAAIKVAAAGTFGRPNPL
jgi:hypothetical protein